MGCDVTDFVEYKTPVGWVPLSAETQFDRHYDMFAMLAGVRGDTVNYPPIVPCRFAWPEDSSFSKSAWTDYHNHTWLTKAEIKAYNWDAECPGFYPNTISTLREEGGKLLDLCAEIEQKIGDADYRILFCFDS